MKVVRCSTKEKDLIMNMRKDDLKVEYIAYKLDRAVSTISRVAKKFESTRTYKKWSTEENNKLISLLENGLTYRQAGKELGRSRDSIKVQVKKIKESRE